MVKKSATSKSRRSGSKERALPLLEQIWIIQQYAVYRRENEIRADYKAKFGKDVHDIRLNQLGRIKYCVNDKAMARKYGLINMIPIFVEARAHFGQETSEIPIANAVYRLKVLDGLLENALAMGNKTTAARLIQQADRAMGGQPNTRATATGASADFSKGIGNFSEVQEAQRDQLHEHLLAEMRRKLAASNK